MSKTIKYETMPILKEVLHRKRPPKEQVRSNDIVVKHPTSKNTWKEFERRVASFFGTRRVPLSGSNSGHGTNSDSLHPELYIECKVRQKSWLCTLFRDTAFKAKAENKLPIVAIKQKNERGYLLVMRPCDLEEIVEIRMRSIKDAE